MSLDVSAEVKEQQGIAFAQQKLRERGQQITPTTLTDLRDKTQAVAGFRRPPEKLPTPTEVAFKQSIEQARQKQTDEVNDMVKNLRQEAEKTPITTEDLSPGDRLRVLKGQDKPL